MAAYDPTRGVALRRRPRRILDRIRSLLEPGAEVAAAAYPVRGSRPEITALKAHLPERLVILDAGCRWGFQGHWEQLGDQITLLGFEPDAQECERLREKYGDRLDARIFDQALGARSETREFHRFRFSAASSMYRHDESALGELAVPREGDALEEVSTVGVVSLDEWTSAHDIDRIDALKLDVQGHELDILRGAENGLHSV